MTLNARFKKMRFADGTPDVRLLWLSELTMRDWMNMGLRPNCQHQHAAYSGALLSLANIARKFAATYDTVLGLSEKIVCCSLNVAVAMLRLYLVVIDAGGGPVLYSSCSRGEQWRFTSLLWSARRQRAGTVPLAAFYHEHLLRGLCT